MSEPIQYLQETIQRIYAGGVGTGGSGNADGGKLGEFVMKFVEGADIYMNAIDWDTIKDDVWTKYKIAELKTAIENKTLDIPTDGWHAQPVTFDTSITDGDINKMRETVPAIGITYFDPNNLWNKQLMRDYYRKMIPDATEEQLEYSMAEGWYLFAEVFVILRRFTSTPSDDYDILAKAIRAFDSEAYWTGLGDGEPTTVSVYENIIKLALGPFEPENAIKVIRWLKETHNDGSTDSVDISTNYAKSDVMERSLYHFYEEDGQVKVAMLQPLKFYVDYDDTAGYNQVSEKIHNRLLDNHIQEFMAAHLDLIDQDDDAQFLPMLAEDLNNTYNLRIKCLRSTGNMGVWTYTPVDLSAIPRAEECLTYTNVIDDKHGNALTANVYITQYGNIKVTVTTNGVTPRGSYWLFSALTLKLYPYGVAADSSDPLANLYVSDGFELSTSKTLVPGDTLSFKVSKRQWATIDPNEQMLTVNPQFLNLNRDPDPDPAGDDIVFQLDGQEFYAHGSATELEWEMLECLNNVTYQELNYGYLQDYGFTLIGTASRGITMIKIYLQMGNNDEMKLPKGTTFKNMIKPIYMYSQEPVTIGSTAPNGTNLTIGPDGVSLTALEHISPGQDNLELVFNTTGVSNQIFYNAKVWRTNKEELLPTDRMTVGEHVQYELKGTTLAVSDDISIGENMMLQVNDHAGTSIADPSNINVVVWLNRIVLSFYMVPQINSCSAFQILPANYIYAENDIKFRSDDESTDNFEITIGRNGMYLEVFHETPLDESAYVHLNLYVVSGDDKLGNESNQVPEIMFMPTVWEETNY